jgi:hypothetical protein
MIRNALVTGSISSNRNEKPSGTTRPSFSAAFSGDVRVTVVSSMVRPYWLGCVADDRDLGSGRLIVDCHGHHTTVPPAHRAFRYHGLATRLERPPIDELLDNVFFDTCVYPSPASTCRTARLAQARD